MTGAPITPVPATLGVASSVGASSAAATVSRNRLVASPAGFVAVTMTVMPASNLSVAMLSAGGGVDRDPLAGNAEAKPAPVKSEEASTS